MWLARFRAACGLFYVIIAIVATGSGDDKAPTSTSSGQAIAAYAATHQARLEPHSREINKPAKAPA